MLYYLPLESYPERYTYQLSAAKVGWLERKWRQFNIQYKRIDGRMGASNIKNGVALDASRRVDHCAIQIQNLMTKADQGLLTENDVIYLDDFWTPGIESIPYYFAVRNLPCPKIYANLWAQSVDEYDFTYPMRHWMRDIEKSYGSFFSGIFVACPSLKDLVVEAGIAPASKIHAVGHPWCTEEVMQRMPNYYQSVMAEEPEIEEQTYRENRVIFSSRLDREKNPEFMLRIADIVLSASKNAKFTICAGSQLRSNMPGIVQAVRNMEEQHKGRFIVLENLEKSEYYTQLCSAKVQLNTSLQDWISFTLLEASVAGCYPIYPYFRSFPEVLIKPEYLYHAWDAHSAAKKILEVLKRNDLWDTKSINQRSWIHTRYDNTWHRMLKVMNILGGEVEDAY